MCEKTLVHTLLCRFWPRSIASGATKCDLAQETFYSIDFRIAKLFMKLLNIFYIYLSSDLGFKFKLKLYLLYSIIINFIYYGLSCPGSWQ